MIRLQFPIWFLILLGFFYFLPAQEIEITATVDRNPVALDEQFVYEVEVSGKVQNLPDIKLPDFSDFMVVGGPSSSSSFQIINFQVSSSRTYTVVLMPRNIGNYKIAPATTTFKGQTYQTSSVEITVTQASAKPQAPSTAPPQSGNTKGADVSQLAFLKVIPSKRTVYINEEVTLQYKIYFRANISGNEILKLPEAVGCWVEEYPTARRPAVYNETINNIRYNVAEIKKVAVFPSKDGKITISPLELMVDIAVPRQKPRDPFNLFDDFFSDPFSQVVKNNISSGAVELTVLPLPIEGKPAGFSGLVGDFTVQSSLDRTTASTNEAISLKIKLAGTGLLKMLNTLPLDFSPDFEVYDPKINESVNKTGAEITSSKEFEYVIIPRVPGNQKIKGMALFYFNPQSKSYKMLQTPEYSLEISKGKEMAGTLGSGTVFSKEEIQLLGKDIRFIKEDLSDLRPLGELPFRSIWFALSLIFPVVVLGGAFLYRNHLDKMSTNVQYARSRKAQKIAQKRLAEARSFWKQNKPELFYGAIANGLIGYLADKTNRPAAGLLRNDLVELLKKSEIETDIQTDFVKCLDEADYRRFAPGKASEADLKDFYQRAEKILIQLEKHF
jgi:BatD DUF11 like domain